MGKRMLCEMAVMFAIGISCVRYHNMWLLVGGMAVIVYLLLQSYMSKKAIFHGLLLTLCMFAGFFRMKVEEANRPMIDALDRQKVEAQGCIYKKEIKNEQSIYYINHVIIKDDELDIICRSAILYPLSDEYSIGTKIKFKGTLTSLQQARNEGNFDEQIYRQSEQIDFKILKGNITGYILPNKIDGLSEKLYQLRNQMSLFYQSELPSEEGGVLSTIALGEKSALDSEVKKLYQLAGISHILAISGLHISVVGMALYQMLRRRGCGFALTGVIATGCVIAYGIFSGMSTSTMRAVGMFFCLMLAAVLGEGYDSLTALGAIALLMLWINPELMASVGFAMSFGAVIGVITIAIPIRNHYELMIKRKREEKYINQQSETLIEKLLQRFLGNMIMGGGIWISTLPLVTWFYYEIPIYVTWLNLLLIPLLPILLFSGLVSGFLGTLKMFSGVFYQLVSRLLLQACHTILYLYEVCADASLKLPLARVITGKPTIVNILIYYGLIYVGIYYMKKRGEGENHSAPFTWSNKKLIAMIMKIGMSLLILGCLLFRPRQKEFGIDVLDVGQGDGTYICDGNGTSLFIDGGSTDVKNVGEYRILPFLKYKGVKRIDYWFVTHSDKDHISGLMDVLASDYRVKNLVFSKAVVDGENYQRLLLLARECDVNIIYMQPGDLILAEQLKMTCIYPKENFVTEDANAASLVLFLQYQDFTGLFTGDTDSEQEAKMIEARHLSRILKQNEQEKIDFLKVAHHGSKGSNSSELLELIKPRYATISCGKDNSYGHPAKEAVERIEKENTKIFYTMDQGQIHIGFDVCPITMIK